MAAEYKILNGNCFVVCLSGIGTRNFFFDSTLQSFKQVHSHIPATLTQQYHVETESHIFHILLKAFLVSYYKYGNLLLFLDTLSPF